MKAVKNNIAVIIKKNVAMKTAPRSDTRYTDHNNKIAKCLKLMTNKR